MKASKILLVDDDEDILEFLKYNLAKNGFKVDTTQDGQSALELSQKKKFDLIILDIMMPGMDGVEVCRKIRDHPLNKETLIAFLTARSEDYTEIAALDSGGDDFITKPIKPSVFLSRIHALLRRSGKKGKNTYEQNIKLGDFEINTEKMDVFIKGKKIQLAKKEFKLVLLLVSKPGKVFTREEILSKVWGNDVIVVNRTIDVHIRKLREKIGDNYIKTLKGVGYKFDY